MKQSIILGIIISMTIGINGLFAQEAGWYRLTKHCGEDGKYILPPKNWEIYKNLFENGHGNMTMFHYRIDDTYSVFDNEVRFTCWYDTVSTICTNLNLLPKSIVEAGWGVYEPTENDFKIRWFNNQPQYKIFPQNTWVTEVLTKVKPSATVEAIDELLSVDFEEKDTTSLLGKWECTGLVVDGTIVKPNVRNIKVYGEHLSLLYTRPKEYTEEGGIPPSVMFHGSIRRVEYISKEMTRIFDTKLEAYTSKDVIRENDNPCIVYWIGCNKYHLVYINGVDTPVEEIWERR